MKVGTTAPCGGPASCLDELAKTVSCSYCQSTCATPPIVHCFVQQFQLLWCLQIMEAFHTTPEAAMLDINEIKVTQNLHHPNIVRTYYCATRHLRNSCQVRGDSSGCMPVCIMRRQLLFAQRLLAGSMAACLAAWKRMKR